MKIGIDARELEGRRTGVGRYLDEVLRALARSPEAHAHTYVLCARQPLDLTAYAGLDVDLVVSPGRNLMWEQVALPGLLRRARVNLLFAPGYSAPIWSPCPVVLVVHDVSFCVRPEWFGWREGARRRVVTRLAAGRAARVVTVSEFSRQEVITHLGVTPFLFILQFVFDLPGWLSLTATMIAAVALCLALLPPFKATLFALQWKHKASEATHRDLEQD